MLVRASFRWPIDRADLTDPADQDNPAERTNPTGQIGRTNKPLFTRT
jgi:hypothetical protein